jgi:predicted amidohydrolase
MTQIRVAAVAYEGTYDVEESLDRHVAILDEAHAAGAQLVVFPELSLHGYPPEEWGEASMDQILDVQALAEELPDGPNVSRLIRHAQQRGLHVVFGAHERSPLPGAIFNSLVLAGPDGHLGTYRKVHLGVVEHQYWVPGDDWPVFDTPLGRIGLLNCADLTPPESARELVLRGAQLLAFSTGWDSSIDGDDTLQQLLNVRAYENFVWFVASNYVGKLGPGVFGGNSQVVDPTGTPVTSLGLHRAGLAFADIDVAGGIAHANARMNRHWLTHGRRPATYRALRGEVGPYVR